jgi:Putative transposase/Transposase zinc-binding domain
MRSTLQQIFSKHFAQYAQSRSLHGREIRAAESIIACRTAKLGGRVLECEQSHYRSIQYHSCRHRSCSRCSEGPRQQWVEQELERLLPCEHVHAVFTLPHVLLPLWEYNRSWFTQRLFDCVRQSVLELCADQRFLGAKPGVLMALHTWGRDLSKHPHIHTLITAGGVDAQGQWQHCRNEYLVPVKALSALFRGKLLHAIKEALNRHLLSMPSTYPVAHWKLMIRQLYKKHWNVHLGQRYASGRGVALYLARYVKGGPISKERPIELRQEQIGFGYTDHRDGKSKRASLHVAQFMRRVLWHAAPRGQHVVRHCGLYASAALGQHDRCMKYLTPQAMPAYVPTHAALIKEAACPTCELPLRHVANLLPAHRFGEITLRSQPHNAQLGVEPDKNRRSMLDVLGDLHLRRFSPVN